MAGHTSKAIWQGIGSLTATAMVLALPFAASAQRETRERHIFVTVTGDNNQPVRDLTAADFIVRENDLAREVLRVSPAPPPTHLALLIDDTAAMEPSLSELRRGLAAFVKAAMATDPKPELTVTSFGERPTRHAPYTTSAEVIDRAINRIFPRPNAGGYLLEAIVEETAELRKRKAERPVIAVLVNEDGPEFSNTTADRVRDVLKAANVPLWTLTLQTRAPALTTEARERGEVLTDVSAASGGVHQMIVSRQAIESGLARMASLIMSRYDVTYARPEAMIPPDTLKVEVKRPKTRVWAPTWTGK